MKPQIFDLTHPLSCETPVYPGDDRPRVDVISVAEEPGVGAERQLNNSSLLVGLHSGTHIDAPFHFFSDRKTIDQVDLGKCCGSAIRLDLRETGQPGVIDAEDLAPLQHRRSGCDKVLIYTGWDKMWGRPEYFTDHPVLTESAAGLLVDLGIDLVGVDFPSVDRPPFPAHLVLLGNDVLIVENLKGLDQLQQYCEFFAMPMPIVGRDASPIRAFAAQDGPIPPADAKPKSGVALRSVSPQDLSRLVRSMFRKSGSDESEAERLAHYLVEANLAGHDSHGVIRVPIYIDYVRHGQLVANQHAVVAEQRGPVLVVEGGSGYGQVIAEEAMNMAIERCSTSGVCILAIRNCGHIGRVGDWPMMAARAGKVSLHFVNTTGFGLLAAPLGGIDRRLSANPIAVGIPVPGGDPIILDISTCAIAEGKIKVARNKGVDVPSGCIIDAEGNATTDPRDFYAEPPGAILPFGGHKGYGLGIVTELLAGALAGSGCSKPGADRLLNGMLAIVIDPEYLTTDVAMGREVEEFVRFVKSSRTIGEHNEILLPGEPEARTRRERLAGGIPLDPQTKSDLRKTALELGVDAELIAILDGKE